MGFESCFEFKYLEAGIEKEKSVLYPNGAVAER
jgi:hypothetical protein